MTESEAQGVLKQLMAWYPGKALDDATQAVWVRWFTELHLETAREAVELASRRHTFFPARAEFQTCYDELIAPKLAQIAMIRRYLDEMPVPLSVAWWTWWERDPAAANNWARARNDMLRETREVERILVPEQLAGGPTQLALPGGR
ncbi:MAG: hypothetical protein M3P51_02380 [Chloroflexota bacterium]|nr:hypothetical protein [Chloroflexota bacterium]